MTYADHPDFGNHIWSCGAVPAVGRGERALGVVNDLPGRANSLLVISGVP
jgi:hypothetical protein